MNFTVLSVDAAKETTFDAVRNDKPLVVDFWNTRCVKCPAALTKMDLLAADFVGRVTFAACALSLNSTSEGTLEHVGELVTDAFPNLRQLYMDYETKEKLKVALEFSALPFAAVYDSAGNLVCKGDPMTDEFSTALRMFLDSVPDSAQRGR